MNRLQALGGLALALVAVVGAEGAAGRESASPKVTVAYRLVGSTSGTRKTLEVVDVSSGRRTRVAMSAPSTGPPNPYKPETVFGVAPTGTLVAFVANGAGGKQLQTLDPQRGVTRRVARLGLGDGSTFSLLTWSADAAKLAYDTRGELECAGGTGKLSIDTLDTRTRRLTIVDAVTAAGDGALEAIAWAPDGRQLAYGVTERCSEGGGISVTYIYVMGADGRGRRIVRDGLNPGLDALVWSPDSTEIAYVSYDDDGEYVATVPAGAGKEGHGRVWQGGVNGHVYGLVWPRPGRELVVDDGTALRAVNVTTGRSRTLMPSQSVFSLVASSDGSSVAVAILNGLVKAKVGATSATIRILRLDGGAAKSIAVAAPRDYRMRDVQIAFRER